MLVWSKKSQKQGSNLGVCTCRQRNIIVGSAKLRTGANTGVKRTYEGPSENVRKAN